MRSIKLFSLILTLNLILTACTGTPSEIEEHLTAESEVSVTSTSEPSPSAIPSPTPIPALAAHILEGSGPDGVLLPTDNLQVHFTQSINMEESPVPGQVYPPLRGTWSWDESNQTASFQPDERFDAGLQYDLILRQKLSSTSGESFQGSHHLRFKIIAPPEVVSHSPGSANLIAQQRPSILLSFSHPMNAVSIETSIEISPPLSFSMTTESPTEFRINILENMQFETRYQFSVLASAADQHGISMLEDYNFDYWVEGLDYTLTPPKLGDVNQLITFDFNYALEELSVEQSIAFTPEIKGTWSWSSNRRRVFLTPADRLPPDEEITVQFLYPVKRTNGVEVPAPSAQTFFSPPPILNYSPSLRDRDPYDYLTRVSIDFSEPMDYESVEASFEMTPPIPGYFTWEENTMFYNFSTSLTRNTDYSVSLTPGLRNYDGDIVLRHPFGWTFNSGYIPKIGQFGEYGAKIQIVDHDGLRPVEFGLMSSDRTRIIFGMHTITYGQLARLMTLDPGFRNPTLTQLGIEEDPDFTFEITANIPGERTDVKRVSIPEDVPTGIYILTLTIDGQVQDQIVIVLTHYSLVLKHANEQLIAWATDNDGSPAPDLSVRVYDNQGRHILNGQTDMNGFFETSLSPEIDVGMVLVYDNQGDTSIAGAHSIWGGSVSYGWFRSASATEELNPYHAYLYTERPIYRPGQTMHFKAIFRRDLDAAYRVPDPDTPVEVAIFDSRDNLLHTLDLHTNFYGSIHGSYQIPEGASLGDYRLVTTFNGMESEQVFKVEDYRKPDVQLSITNDQDQYVDGEKISLEIDAAYFFDQPVANASLTVRRFELGEFYGYWWEPDWQDEPTYVWYEVHGSEQKLRTDQEGHANLTLDAHMGSEEYRRWYWPSNLESSTFAIEVTLDDGSHQTVSQVSVIKVFNAREKLFLDTAGYVHELGDSIEITASLSTLSGEPINERTLTLEIYQWDRSGFEYVVTPESWSATTGARGQAQFTLLDLKAGHYRAEVHGTDIQGNPYMSRRWFGIFEDAVHWPWTHSTEDIVINFDKDEYNPYEEATAYIESNFEGLALITLERGRVHYEQVIELTPPITRYDFTVVESYAPNIFMTVSAWQPTTNEDTEAHYWSYMNLPETRLKKARAEIAVNPIGKNLDLYLETDKAIYTPGEEVELLIQVTDDRGNPVSAEVSLALVDEAIFSLSEELSQPIYEAYFGRRPLTVTTRDSMSPSRWILSPGLGGGGGDGGMMPGSIRSDFPDTAIWVPALQTDSQGEARIRVTLPDNLTTWRITGRAITRSTAVGENSETIVTQKPLLVRPILPRVVTLGDQFNLTVSVHNYSDEIQDVTVGYIADSLSSNDENDIEVTLQAGESQFLGWWVSATELGDNEIIFWADSKTAEDAVQTILPIQALTSPDVLTQIGQFEGQESFDVFIPDTAVIESEVILELSPSLLGNLASGLEYLTGFPYGCVEQIMSRALPNAVVGRVFQAVGASDLAARAELDQKVAAGLASLYAMQHKDGGWGWWYDDETNAYQTAWVIFGLALTSEAGYEVDPQVLERGSLWLGKHLEEMDNRTRAYALYSMALAGHGDLTQTRDMIHKTAELDTFSLAALALALHDLGASTDAQQLLTEIEERVTRREGRAFWSSPHEDGYYYQKTMASSVRTSALSLDALIRIGGDEDLITDSVRWLMSKRELYGWGTTNETSFVLLSLGDYMMHSLESQEALAYQISLNGVTLKQARFGAEQPRLILTLGIENFVIGLNELSIETDEGQALYYVLSSRMLLPEKSLDPDGIIHVKRTYHDAHTGEMIETASAGQLVEVRLTITTPEKLFFVLVEDHLPGGLDALNERINSDSRDIDPDGEPQFRWNSLGYNYKDVRGDSVTFFITEANKGKTNLRYMARATRSGTFTALPAEAYPMYDLSTWGRSASTEFSVDEYDSEVIQGPENGDT